MEKFFETATFLMQAYIVYCIIGFVIAVPFFIWWFKQIKKMHKENEEFKKEIRRNMITFERKE